MNENQVSDADDKERRKPGRTRDLSARQSVRIFDKLATKVITIGGLFVILAVIGIMAFLVAVALPLFAGETITGSGVFRVGASKSALLSVEVDDYNTIAVLVSKNGVLTPVHASTGKALRPLKLDFGGAPASAFGRTLKGGNVAFGFPDGTVRFGKVNFRTQILPADRVPKGLTKIDARDFTDGKVVFSEIPGDQMRKIWLEAELEKPQQVAPKGTPIVKLDYKVGGTPERPSISFATVDAKGVARLSLTETRINLLTGQTTSSVETVVLPDLPTGTRIVDILLTEKADKVYIGVEKGFLLRYDTRSFDAITLVEKSDPASHGREADGVQSPHRRGIHHRGRLQGVFEHFLPGAQTGRRHPRTGWCLCADTNWRGTPRAFRVFPPPSAAGCSPRWIPAETSGFAMQRASQRCFASR